MEEFVLRRGIRAGVAGALFARGGSGLCHGVSVWDTLRCRGLWPIWGAAVGAAQQKA